MTVEVTWEWWQLLIVLVLFGSAFRLGERLGELLYSAVSRLLERRRYASWVEAERRRRGLER